MIVSYPVLHLHFGISIIFTINGDSISFTLMQLLHYNHVVFSVCLLHYIGHIWMVGDSMIYWAASYLVKRGESAMNLGLPHHTVTWKGLRGGHLADMPDFIYKSLRRHYDTSACTWPCNHVPAMIVIHVGTNDLLTLDLVQFRHRCRHVVAECIKLMPHSVMVWSDILPRHWYDGAHSQCSVDLKRKSMNKTARAIILANGGKVIKHANFHWETRSLFREDHLHLDLFGQFLFANNLRKALIFFHRNPEAWSYRASNLGISFGGANLSLTNLFGLWFFLCL